MTASFPLGGRLRLLAAALALAGSLLPAAAEAAGTPARDLFGAVATPSPGASISYGSYARGCLAGAAALPVDGPAWQAMRLSRNRNWGRPELVAYLERLAADAAADGWPGLLIGDMSQPRGGPMRTGHASHQIGLDADIWFLPMPGHLMSRQEREELSAVSLLRDGRLEVDPARWSPAHARLLQRAASYPQVARIFVSAAIKLKLCQTVAGDRGWLRKIRPWGGHDSHFHVRLECPAGVAGCVPQDPPPQGDGCGAELASWFEPPPPPPEHPAPPAPPLTLADLPAACAAVLQAGGGPPAAEVPLPRPRPD